MYSRYKLNKQIDFSTIVPIKTLFLDYLNHENQNMSDSLKEFIISKVKEFHL